MYLLDVNVLIALMDPGHLYHEASHGFFPAAKRAGWATCPLTENGVMRILSAPSYPNRPGGPGVVADMLDTLCGNSGHVFWPDDVCLLDEKRFDRTRLLSSSPLTDSYLLGLAVKHGGKLATHDRRLQTSGVRMGETHVHLIR